MFQPYVLFFLFYVAARLIVVSVWLAPEQLVMLWGKKDLKEVYFLFFFHRHGLLQQLAAWQPRCDATTIPDVLLQCEEFSPYCDVHLEIDYNHLSD